jgi:hypothetical protein
MVTPKDLIYHVTREAKEREQANAATDPAVRSAHLHLADAHGALAAQLRRYLDERGIMTTEELKDRLGPP